MHNVIVFCASYLIILPVLVVIYIEIKTIAKHNYELLAIAILVSVIGLLLAKLGSALISDPRPFVYGPAKAMVSSGLDNGFPSDHTLLSSILAVVGWHYSKKLGIGLALLAAVIGWARVAAHVHHLKDILGAMVIAVVAYIIATVLYKVFRGCGSAPLAN